MYEASGYQIINIFFSLRNVLPQSMHARKKLKGGMGASHPPNLKICHFAGQKQQYNVVLQGNLLDPGQTTEHIFTI